MNTKKISIAIPVVEFTKRVLSNGGISFRGILLLPLYYFKLAAVMPFAFLQWLFYSKKIKQTVIAKSPIFIIGHYRSGTTYLHKLMAADKQFGYVSYYDMICPNSSLLLGNGMKKLLQFFINKLKIKTSFFNNTFPSLDEPAEEERFLINKGSAYANYWKFVFPLKKNVWQQNFLTSKKYYSEWKAEYMWLMKLITYKNEGKQLVVKSPCNTERIKYLLQIFPDAKFIYISRDPRRVFYSTINLWKKAIQKFSLQHVSASKREEIIFTHYAYMMDEYKRNKHLIPAKNLIEITYEELELQPLSTIKKIYTSLHIPAFNTAQKNLKAAIQNEKRYKKFDYTYDEKKSGYINKTLDIYINEWKEKVCAETHKALTEI